MKLFIIFFWMAIGCACLDLQRIEDGENYVKYNNNARKAASLTANETISGDQQNPAKHVDKPGKSADTSSTATKAREKPQSAMTPVTVTFEVKKSGKRAQIGRRVTDLRSLLKHLHPHISPKRYSMEVQRNFPGTSTAIRDTYKDSAIKTKRSIRKKRKGDGGWRGMHIGSTWVQRGFKAATNECNDKERELLRSLATTGTVSTDVLNEYKEAKEKQRKRVYDICKEEGSGSIPCTGYKRIIKDTIAIEGVVYDYDDFGLGSDFREFLNKPSPALDKFKAMKQKEYDTIDSFIMGSGSGDIYDGQTGNEFEGGAIKNPAESGFECPRKKRESGSVASQVDAQVLTILSCMVIGIIVVGLQGLEFGEDDLKENKNARKVRRGRRCLLDRIESGQLRRELIAAA